ncbi:MAG: hypothetical protein ACYC9W_04300 [Candidatus Limnocylindria bacterium]
MPDFKLLQQLERTFRDGPYVHRNSNLGNRIADYLYEDLYDLGESPEFRQRVDAKRRVLNPRNVSPGIHVRRGDGSFGTPVPGSQPASVPGFVVARGTTAEVEIGAEVKILAKAMIKQIDRVMNDLRSQASHLQAKSPRALTIGIVAVNFADHYISHEGERRYPTDGSGGNPHPSQEGPKAELRLRAVQDRFSEFLQIGFRATNEPPYPFELVAPARVENDYGSILVRLSREYDRLF